jgi:hypothetical protein
LREEAERVARVAEEEAREALAKQERAQRACVAAEALVLQHAAAAADADERYRRKDAEIARALASLDALRQRQQEHDRTVATEQERVKAATKAAEQARHAARTAAEQASAREKQLGSTEEALKAAQDAAAAAHTREQQLESTLADFRARVTAAEDRAAVAAAGASEVRSQQEKEQEQAQQQLKNAEEEWAGQKASLLAKLLGLEGQVKLAQQLATTAEKGRQSAELRWREESE